EVHRRLARVPAGHGVTRAASPSAKCLHILHPVEQMRSRTRDALEHTQRGGARLRVAQARGEGEREERRVVLRRTTALADLDNALHDAHAILGDARDDRLRVLTRERSLGDVERAALRSEDEKTLEARPVVDGPG